MLIICRVYEDGQQHRELPAIVKSRVSCVLEHDGRYKNIPCTHRRYEQGQQYQTHQETSKPHITILVKIFLNTGFINPSRENTDRNHRYFLSMLVFSATRRIIFPKSLFTSPSSTGPIASIFILRYWPFFLLLYSVQP